MARKSRKKFIRSDSLLRIPVTVGYIRLSVRNKDRRLSVRNKDRRVMLVVAKKYDILYRLWFLYHSLFSFMGGSFRGA